MAGVGTVMLNNTTISGNTANQRGGGIYTFDRGSATLQNTILAGNTAPNGPDCSWTLVSAGYNLIGNTSDCTFTPTDSDLTYIDAKLGLLQDNGGPTETHALLSGSPAIDAGSCRGTTADQRGKPRPVDIPFIANADDGCDIGSYEFDGVIIPVFLPIILRNY
jgi:parallel beta-helix repeat protein